jgi:predicted nucleotidyltransferase
MKKYDLLKTIVGSQAHGLATKSSDFDYRGVFIVPTSELLKLGQTVKTTSWIEGHDDDTSWEVGHFLNMAVHCNPTALETFLAPVANLKDGIPDDELKMFNLYGQPLRELFPYVWNANDVKNAFIGYGVNQRKKFFENKDSRAPKYAAAYARVLYNAQELLNTGTFTIKIADTEIGETVKKFKNGEYTPGEVIQTCWDLETKVLQAFKSGKFKNKETDIRPVNEYLLKIRKDFWE